DADLLRVGVPVQLHQPGEEARVPGHGRGHLRVAGDQLDAVRGLCAPWPPPGEHRGPERLRGPDRPDDLLPRLAGAVLRLPDGAAPIRIDATGMSRGPSGALDPSGTR